MAQINVTKILDGARNSVLHIFIAGDGSGDLSGEVVADPTVFDPAMPGVPTLTIEDIKYDFVGFNGYLAFDDLVSGTPVWAMSGGQYSEVCLKDFGGIKDRSSVDGDGKLKLTTSGLSSGDVGVIVLELRKN